MSAENMVDAALAGLDQGELVTIPALPDAADWDRFEAARKTLAPNLSHAKPAGRYGIVLSQSEESLDAVLADAANTALKEFAAGLRRDVGAVRAALETRGRPARPRARSTG